MDKNQKAAWEERARVDRIKRDQKVIDDDKAFFRKLRGGGCGSVLLICRVVIVVLFLRIWL
jgi:hypothetical protein